MSAIARLWYKWVIDPIKPYTIDDVPTFWKKEVQELVDKEKRQNAEESSTSV